MEGRRFRYATNKQNGKRVVGSLLLGLYDRDGLLHHVGFTSAIKQQDTQKFAAAYDQVTQGCNACHMELDHPYVVIKTPDASAFPNQEFKAQR